MQGLEGALELVGTDFESPGIGGYRRNFAAVQPPCRAEGQTRGGSSGIILPAQTLRAGVLPGSDDHDISAAHL